MHYGKYSVHPNITYVTKFIFSSNLWFAVGVFCLLLIITGVIEYFILPYFIILFKPKPLSKIDKLAKIHSDKAIKVLIPINPFNINYKKYNIMPIDIYSYSFRIPIGILLFAICLYNYSIIASILLLLLSIFFLFHIINIFRIYK